MNCKLFAKCNSLAIAGRFTCNAKYTHIQSQRCYCCNSASIRSNDSNNTISINDNNNNLCQALNSNDSNNNSNSAIIGNKSSCNDVSESSTTYSALETRSSIPVYLKPSRSAFRKPSFYIPRLRDAVPESYAFKVDGLGSALPLFSIFASSCEYFAMRIPLIKAGFKRVPMQSLHIKSNLVWGRSALPVLLMRERDVVKLMERTDSSGGDNKNNNYSVSGKRTRDQLMSWCKSNEIWNSYQVFNHFPQSHCYLGCKRGLAHELRDLVSNSVHDKSSSLTKHMRKKIAGMYSFSPQTWFYPQEKEKLFAILNAAPSNSWFIWKPARGSCGRGIQLVQGGATHAAEWTKLANEIDYRAKNLPHGKLYSSYVVQEYISNPLLLHGRKMDLRLYVAVTSFDPLIVYWHEEGLVRLAAEVYEQDESYKTSENKGSAVDKKDEKNTSNSEGNSVQCTADKQNEKEHQSKMPFNVYSHLTNYSIGRRYNSTPSTINTSTNAHSNSSRPHSQSESESESESMYHDEHNNDDEDGDGVHSEEFEDNSNNEEVNGLTYRKASQSFNAQHSASLLSSASSSPTLSHQQTFEESSSEGTWLKWSLEKLWSYLDHDYNQLHNMSINNLHNSDSVATQSTTQPLLSERVKTEIGLLIVRTLMAVKPKMHRAAQHYNKKFHNKFFEVYGFDVMLDNTLQPHLIEVNTLPSLASTSSFDYATKTNVISDALNLAMMEPFARNPEAMMEYTMNNNVTSLPAPEVMKYVHCDDESGKASPCESSATCSSDKAEISSQVHSYSDATVRHAVLSPSIAKELQWQLQDEIDYARGFKLLYPPVKASSLPAVSDDISAFADLGLLTPRDLCLLEMS